MTDIGTLGGPSATAADINNKGQIVGWSDTTQGDRRPYLWRPNSGCMADLGTLGAKKYSLALAINNHSEVLGVAWGRHEMTTAHVPVRPEAVAKGWHRLCDRGAFLTLGFTLPVTVRCGCCGPPGYRMG